MPKAKSIGQKKVTQAAASAGRTQRAKASLAAHKTKKRSGQPGWEKALELARRSND